MFTGREGFFACPSFFFFVGFVFVFYKQVLSHLVRGHNSDFLANFLQRQEKHPFSVKPYKLLRQFSFISLLAIIMVTTVYTRFLNFYNKTNKSISLQYNTGYAEFCQHAN